MSMKCLNNYLSFNKGMDLHRLRVVEFDTSVKEKEREKKHNAELERRQKEERKTSTIGNGDQIGDEHQCLYENTSPPGVSKKCFAEEMRPPGTLKKYVGDTLSGTIKQCVNDDRTPPRTSKKCLDVELLPPRTSKKYTNNTATTSHLRTPKIQRSKSEMFKISHKKQPRKRAIKTNSSDIGLTKRFQASEYSHQKKRTLKLRNRSKHSRIHHKEENVKEKKEKSEEVHFLFEREKPSFIRYRRKRTYNERTKKLRDSKSPNDIYGFQTSNRLLNQNQYQMSHFNFIDTDKLPFKKLRVGFHREPKRPQPVPNSFCKYHAMRVLNSAYGNGDSRPIYYNLGLHPHPRRYQQKQRRDQEEGFKKERSHCMAKDEIVGVSLSSFSPVSKSFHDARTGPSKVELTTGSYQPLSLLENSTTLQNFTVASEYNQKLCPLSSTRSPYAACAAPADRQPCELKKSQTLQDVTCVGYQKPCALPSTPTLCSLCVARAQHKRKKKRKKTKKPFLILSLCHGFLSRLVNLVTDFHTRNKLSGKSCIKYVVFGLLFVVWSPCLLAVILVWVVMFPWNLPNILKTDVTANHSFKRFRKSNLRREYQRMCFENCSPGKKRSFMTSAAIWFSRTAGVVVNSFNAVISLLKLKKKAPTRACSLFLSSCHPNPRKRYKLFYADNRGWVMKPLRRRTRACARNRVVQNMRCELRPKYWQKVRGQASLIKVPCTGHGTDLTDPIHQSSPAGNACLARSRNPRCSCICKDKYSQCPSTFMPLHSHHHRQHQVNIPPKFYYTKSATASTPTEKTKNIAYKYLAMNRLRQRKNGTLAFGIVSNSLNKRDVGDTLTDITDHFSTCGLNRLGRQATKRQIPFKCLTAKSHKLVIANKNSILTPKHIPYQKVTNKPKTAKAKTEMASKRARDAKFLPPKQTYTYKTRAPTQKHTSSATIKSNIKHDITVNYSFGNKRKQSEQGYNYTPEDLVSVKTQMLSNTADITTMTNRDVALNCFCRKKHNIFKHGYEHKPHKISAATQKQLRTADITTSTNRNVALNCPREEDHGWMSKHGDKHKPQQNPIATQMQSRTADTATSTKHNVALNFPCEEKRKPSKHGYQHKPRKIQVATQMQLKTADITTSTNRNVATNCLCEEKYKPSEQGYKHKPHQILVATQKQSKTAENATDTNRDLALNGPCEGHGTSQHGYKHKLPVATQMQQRTADNATDTNRDVALNYHGGVMPSTANKEKLCIASTNDKVKQYIQEMNVSKPVYKYIPGQIPDATQKQSNTADITTITNCNIALNYPYRDKHEQYELAYKCKPDHIPVGAKKQPSKANILTSTEYIGGITQSTPNKSIRRACDPSTSDKDTICNQKTNPLEYLSKNQDISTQKHSDKIDASANCISDYEKRKTDKFFISEQAMPPNKTVDCTEATTSSKKTPSYRDTQTIAYSTLIGDIDTECPKRALSKEIVNCSCRTKLKQIATAVQFPLAYNTNTYKSSSAKEPQNKQSKLPQAPSHTVQEEPKLFGIASDCTCGTNQQNPAKKSSNNISIEQPKVLKESRHYGSQKTPEIDTQRLTPGSVTAHARKIRITTESPPASTDIQELLCDCKCECNSVPPLKSKLPRYFPSAQPELSNKDKTLSKFPNSPAHLPSKSSQKSSPFFEMASDCRCGEVPPINEPDKELKQIKVDSKNILTYKTGSAKERPSKHPNLIQGLSRTLQEQSKFVIASDCTCGTNQTTTAEKNLIRNVTSSKSTTAKEIKSKSPPAFAISKFSKSPEHSSLPCKCCYKSLPRKCRCPVESLQDSSGKPPNKISKLTSKRSVVRVDKNPKSSENTPSHEYLQQTCPCPVEGLQVPIRKQSAGIKVNKTFSKINSVKVDKTRAKYSKLSEHTSPQEYLHHDCTCPVKNLQDPVGRKTSYGKSVFSRKSKEKPPDECPCFFSQNNVNKIIFKSDNGTVPVNWNTTKRFFIRSRGSTCSFNDPCSRDQSSRISQYSSKVSSLVTSLRSKLFSRKSKQTKVPENPTKKPLPVILSSMKVKPKKADKRAISIDNILESQLDDETNQSLFQRSQSSKTSQNSSLSLHSNHSSCSCQIHKSFSRPCRRKNQNAPKLLTLDKTYSCLHSVTKSIIVDPRVSQSIIGQQSKTSKQSSIVTLFKRKSYSKSQSAQKQSSKKFDPQYTSTLINCQPTPTIRQTLRSQLPPSPKQPSLLNRPQSKLFLEKIRSVTDTLKDRQKKKYLSTPGVQTAALIYPSKCACSPEKRLHLSKKISSHSVERATVRQPQVSDQSFHLRSTQQNITDIDSFHRSYPPKLLKVKTQFEVLPQLKAEQVVPIISGSCTCAEDLKITKEYLSNKKQFEAMPQSLKAAQVIPIVSGTCTCTGEQNYTIKNSSNNKLLTQPNTNSTPLGNVKLPEFLQHLANQTLKSPASQRHSSHQTGIPFKAPLRHFQSKHTKPCKCRRFKHGKEHEVSNSLHKIVKNRRSQEKFHKSHLISHVCTCSATTRRLREHIVHRSEISRSPGIQPSPLIHILYEQNLPDQKRLSKIPINIDKPEMLQQHSPGHGRKSTAKGEVRQPYPDFNRVSMRYPGHKSPPKQSLQIPGINGPPPANNYRPAPGTTPPPNYVSDPFNTQPPKRYLSKSPYDESALRRAYKRRPLRYTPPRQQLPKATSKVMLKKSKENNLRAAEDKKSMRTLRTENFFKCLRRVINKSDREVWPEDDICHPMWLKTLEKKQKILQKNKIKTNKSCWQLFAYFITLCCWSPFLWCGYLCCNVLCKCCS